MNEAPEIFAIHHISNRHDSNDMLLYLVMTGITFIPVRSTDKVVCGVLLILLFFRLMLVMFFVLLVS